MSQGLTQVALSGVVLFYPVNDDPARYTSQNMTALLTALKCDLAVAGGISPSHLTYTGAASLIDPGAAPALQLFLAAAATAATAADDAACAAYAAAARRLRTKAEAPRALYVVTGTAPLVSVSFLVSVVASDPVVARVPVGSFVAPVVQASLLSALRFAAANLPRTNAVWSAINGVTDWNGLSFLAGGDITVIGGVYGTLANGTTITNPAPSPAPNSATLPVAIGLGVGVAVLALAALATFLVLRARRLARADAPQRQPYDYSAEAAEAAEASKEAPA